MSDYKRINVRLTKLNQAQLGDLWQYVEADPLLGQRIKNDNQLMNFVLSEFILLFCNTRQDTQQVFSERETQLLGGYVATNSEKKIKKKLTTIDQQTSQLMYLVMSIYNRTPGTLEEGGSIFTPGGTNNTTKQLLQQMVEADYQKNEIRQQ